MYKITDEEVLLYAKLKFGYEFENKFRAGMAKYQTPIYEKDGIAEAFPEVWDLVAYLTVATVQQNNIREMVHDLSVKHPALLEDPIYLELRDAMRSKPLAMKKA